MTAKKLLVAGCALSLLALAMPAASPAADGTWDRAWGQDVISNGAMGDTGTGFEICTFSAACKVGVTTAPALGGELNGPRGVATDSAGNVYVSDLGHNRIQKFDALGNFQRAWGKDVASSGPGDTGSGFEICVAGVDTCQAGDTSTSLGGELSAPFAVATDSAGNVYVGDSGNNRIQKFSSSGAFQRAWGKDVIQAAAPENTGTGFEICTVAANCKTADFSTGLAGELSNPQGIAVDSSDAVYVGDTSNYRIQKFDSAGNFLRTWGGDVASAGPGNTGTETEICVAGVDTCKEGVFGQHGGIFNSPNAVTTDGAGGVYVADGQNSRLQKFDSGGSFVSAWGWDVISPGGPGDVGSEFEICTVPATCKVGTAGAGAGGMFINPYGLSADSAGHLYVSDRANSRVQVFDFAGDFLRLWGKDVISSGAPGDTGSGFEICVVRLDCKAGPPGSLGGELNDPVGLAVGAGQSLYVAEAGNHRVQRFVGVLPQIAAKGGVPAGTGSPSNAFGVGKLKGRTLTITVSSAGTVQLSDASTSGRLAFAAAKRRLLKPSSASGGPGVVKVKVKLTPAAKKRLKDRGKVRPKAKITFTPTGGTPNSRVKKLKIKQ